MPNKHAQSLSLTVRNLYVQYRLLFLVLGLLIMMDVSQYCVYIKSMYHACLLKRLTDRRRAADAVHSFLHKNVCDLLIVCKHFTHCCFFCDFHDLYSPFWICNLTRNPGFLVSWFPGFFRSYNIIITVSSIIASLNLFFSFSVLYPLRQQFPFFPCSTFSSHKYNTGSEGSALRSMRQDLPDIHLQNLFFLQQT